ncbi:MAG: hypothetical protein II649_04435 [Kiritimatiellae bacterium]|nr:hypothetical protein [Kiritimatiellia bacterium]
MPLADGKMKGLPKATSVPLFMDDPNWADCVPDMKSGGPKCRLPSHEDCSPLDPDAVAHHLQPGGTLGGMEGYEPRPGQIDMLRAVVRAFNNREHLMVEAGTGVGKSLAYLVPSVLWSFTNDTPVVLSTNTRNLQSQLIAHDLPRAAQVLGDDAGGFRAAVLKGRSNYLCLRALEEVMQGGWFTLDEDEKPEFERLVEWLHRTPDGDLDDLGAETLRPRLSCPGEDCMGRRCRYAGKCFIAKARARAMRAHVIVANHALVLAEATSPGSGILPAYGRLVFDEAHNLEDVATEFFSYELSRPALLQLMGKLVRTQRTRRGGIGHKRGIIGTVERQLAKGDLAQSARAGEIRELCTRAQVQSRFALKAGEELFEVLGRLFSPAQGASVLRYRCVPPSGIAAGDPKARPTRQYSLHGLFADYTPAQWDEGDLSTAANRFENALARLQGILVDLATALQFACGANELPLFGDLAGQVQGLAQTFTEFILESRFILAANDPSRVYWAERRSGDPSRKFPPYICLTAAPLSIAEEMKRHFYDTKDSVILCSATLRVGDRFDYMGRRLGFSLCRPERIKALAAASPFDYFRQALVMAAESLPDPSSRGKDYVAGLAPFLVDLFSAVRGRGLVLFTSYEMMRETARLVNDELVASDVEFLVQGDGLSREAMVERLKKAAEPGAGKRPVVLFGAQSFWEGVDVPGDALSCVVIARLPFPQVGEPIVEARSEKVTEEGGSSFRDYMIPEAVIRFRQGVGRLVRTKSDRGVVVVADSRIVSKNYGPLFRHALAASVHAVPTLPEIVSRASEFFDADGR